MKKKNPWIAFLLSFFCIGLGQLYNHQVKKAIIFFLISFFSSNLLIWTGILKSFPTFYIVILFVLLVNIYMIADAVIVSKKNRSVNFLNWDKWYVYLIIIILSIGFNLVLHGGNIRDSLPVETYFAPTSSMEPAICLNDYFVVDKQDCDIKRKDIFVFISPTEGRDVFIKRCMGLPGDIIELKKGLSFINGKLYENKDSLKLRYIVKTNNPLNLKTLKEKGIDEVVTMNGLDNIMFLNKTQMEYVKQLSIVESFEQIIENEGERDNYLLQPKNSNWNMDFYGPLQIPKSGDIIYLDTGNIEFYRKLITEFEGNQLDANSLKIIINGKTSTSYTVKKNYYWSLGDNRANSMDSRHYGFVPEEFILGKPLFIYWSKDKSRIGMKLN